MTSLEIRNGSEMQRQLAAWTETLAREQLADQRYVTALEAIDEALGQTIAYMRDRRDGRTDVDVPRERELYGLWTNASVAVSPLDSEVSNALLIKASGWTDPAEWERAASEGYKISIADVQKVRESLSNKRGNLVASNDAAAAHRAARSDPVPAWFPMAGVAFSAVTIIFLMYLVLGPALDPSKRTVFNVLMAFCTAASTAFLTGSAIAQGTIPGLRVSPVTFSAKGGIGVFVVVFLILQYTA